MIENGGALADDLEAEFRDSHSLLREIEAVELDLHFISRDDVERVLGMEVKKDGLKEALAWHLKRIYRKLSSFLEALGLSHNRQEVETYWSSLDAADIVATREWHTDEGDGVDSPVLTELRHFAEPLFVMLKGTDGNPPQEAQRAILENILRSTAWYVAQQSVNPTKEPEVTATMIPLLKAAFSDYTNGNPIPKVLKYFKPDGSIPSLAATIEFKFVDSEAEMNTAYSGIIEDIGGYGGTKDWTRFYAVIYQTGPYGTEHRFREGIERSGGAGTWVPIMVTGPGGRKP